MKSTFQRIGLRHRVHDLIVPKKTSALENKESSSEVKTSPGTLPGLPGAKIKSWYRIQQTSEHEHVEPNASDFVREQAKGPVAKTSKVAMSSEVDIQRRAHPTAVLHADIKGYSRHCSEDLEGTVERLRTARAIFSEVTAHFGGEIVWTQGDAWLLDMPDPKSAYEAGKLIQQRLAEAFRELPEEKRIEVRMGIDYGRVLFVEGDQIYGKVVCNAIELEAHAPVGGICLSPAMAEALMPVAGDTVEADVASALTTIDRQRSRLA